MQALASRGDGKSFRLRFGRGFTAILRGGKFTPAQTMVLFAAIFWAGTYCLFSIRSVLYPPIDVDLISSKRLFTTFVGALLFLGALACTARLSKPGSGRNYVSIIASTIVASATLLLLRLAYNDLAEPYTFGLTDHARWVLVWSGYFLGGLALFSPETTAAAIEPDTAPASASERDSSDALWVQRNKQLVKLPLGDIEWLEAQGNYVFAHSAEAGGLLRASLASLEERFEAHGFIRVHRSALCQQGHIRALRRTSGGALAVVLASGAEIPVGRRFADNVLAITGG